MRFFASCIVALAVMLVCSAGYSQNCVNGVCYGPPIYAQPVYQLPPIVVHQAPLPAPSATESPTDCGHICYNGICRPCQQQPVLCPQPDPWFSRCHNGYCRPCPPSGSTSYRRTVGVGLNLSWNSNRNWNRR